METHFEILIDASGSMGYMPGSKEYENKYLLPDKSTRMSLVKNIINESLLDKLTFADSINISTFRVSDILNGKGDKIIKTRVVVDENGQHINERYYDSFNDLKSLFNGAYDKDLIKKSVDNILDPEIGGTPLYWALSVTLHNNKNKNNIIVLSDGDANDEENFDEKIINLIKENNFDCTIYFIGIDQNAVAEGKSRRLADFTKGKFVNVKAINYDKSQFDNFLFEVKTSVVQDAIAISVSQNSPEIQSEPVTTNSEEIETETETENKPQVENLKKQQEELEETKDSEKKPEIKESEIEEPEIEKNEVNDTNIKPELLSKLEQEVANNSKSISLISSQLDTLVNQIKYLSKITTSTKEDDDTYFDSDIYEDENIITGRRCEEYLYTELLKKNWDDVKWLNEISEQYEPYDFRVIHEGATYYIECKGTKGIANEFSLTKKEWLYYLDYKPNYRLYFVSNIDSNEPQIQKFDDLITSFENQDLIPFSPINRNVKADRFWIQVDNRKS